LLPTALLVGGCGLLGGGNVFELAVGDCFDATDDAQGGRISDVPIVDCAEPHDREVFQTFEVADGAFPGKQELAARAREECIPAFEEYVGAGYGSGSRLGILPITPTQSSWDNGDREVVCTLYDLEGAQLEGSMEGSGE
jgi:hypothetical protein